MSEQPEERLYAPDVAKLMGISLAAARRRMRRWENRYGAQVVGRDWGGDGHARRYATLAGLETTKPTARRRTGDLPDRVKTLEDEQVYILGQLRTITHTLESIGVAVRNGSKRIEHFLTAECKGSGDRDESIDESKIEGSRRCSTSS